MARPRDAQLRGPSRDPEVPGPRRNGARRLAGADPGQPRRLPPPEQPRPRHPAPVPSGLRGGQPPLLRPPPERSGVAARGGLRQGDRSEMGDRLGGAHALQRELRLPADAPPGGPSGNRQGDRRVRMAPRRALVPPGVKHPGGSRHPSRRVGGGVHHQALLGVRDAARPLLAGVSGGASAVGGLGGVGGGLRRRCRSPLWSGLRPLPRGTAAVGIRRRGPPDPRPARAPRGSRGLDMEPGNLNPLEIFAVLTSAGGTWLLARNSPLGWWIGLVGIVLYGFVFYQARLFAEIGLQVVYFVTSLQAIYIWLHGGERKRERPGSRISPLWVLSTLVLARAG